MKRQTCALRKTETISMASHSTHTLWTLAMATEGVKLWIGKRNESNGMRRFVFVIPAAPHSLGTLNSTLVGWFEWSSRHAVADTKPILHAFWYSSAFIPGVTPLVKSIILKQSAIIYFHLSSSTQRAMTFDWQISRATRIESLLWFFWVLILILPVNQRSTFSGEYFWACWKKVINVYQCELSNDEVWHFRKYEV